VGAQVDAQLVGPTVETLDADGPDGRGGQADGHETVQTGRPELAGLEIRELALLGLDVRVGDLVGDVGALAGEDADAGHSELLGAGARRRRLRS
jgi:hypothetical protein